MFQDLRRESPTNESFNRSNGYFLGGCQHSYGIGFDAIRVPVQALEKKHARVHKLDPAVSSTADLSALSRTRTVARMHLVHMLGTRVPIFELQIPPHVAWRKLCRARARK
jgi:hypothetical protein